MKNVPSARKMFLMTPVLCILISGCSTTRYVSVPCLTQEQYDKLKADEPPKVKDQLTGEADKDVKIVAGSAVRLRAWGSGLLGVLGGCRG